MLQKQEQQTKMILIAAYLLVAILTDSLAAGQVNVESSTSLHNEGDRAELLCRYGRSITYCRIEIPGEKVLNLSPDWSKTPGFTYFGAGLAAGQCGVSIDRVKAINNGQVKCSLGVEGEELSGTMELIVALRPQQPIIELFTKADREGYFLEGSQFKARCIVRDGRPAANITWLIDDFPADKRVSPLEVLATPTDRNVTLSTTVQEIQWHLGAEDNRRKLICRSHHQTDRENVPPQEGAFQLLVRFPPIRQSEALVYGLYMGHTAMVNMTIRANPAPTVEWTVDGNVIGQGMQNGRFSVYEPQPLDQDYYNVTMAIAGLTLEDTTKVYQLRATNHLGSTDYQVRISSSSTPPTAGLDIGAIVGIVVAVAVLIVVALLIVFARATGRWCFGGATLNTDIGPDSEAQINPHHNDDFDGREFTDGEEHIDTTHQSEEATPPVTDKLETQKKADLKSKTASNAPPPVDSTTTTGKSTGKTPTNETSDTESADFKATSSALSATAPTSSEIATAATTTESAPKSKSKRLPSLAAIFKRLNERDSIAVKKRHTEDDAPEDVSGGATTAQGVQAPESIEASGNEPKEDKQLVYAELVLKPAEGSDPAPPPPSKNATEYAEIVYVQKPNDAEGKH